MSKKSVNEGGAINWPVYRDQLPRTIGTPWTQKDDEFNENNGGDQNPSPIQRMTQAPLVLPGLTPANLFKFLLTTVAAAPEAKIGLTGMELAGAVFEALPGFLRELGGVWSPGGGHL